jgi:hypothetical protein
MRRLTTGLPSEKCVVRRFRHCANVMECSYTNLETWHQLGFPYGLKSIQASVFRIGRFHSYWRFALASNFPPKSACLEFPKILTIVVYAVHRWLKRRYAAHGCTKIRKIRAYYTWLFNWIFYTAWTCTKVTNLVLCCIVSVLFPDNGTLGIETCRNIQCDIINSLVVRVFGYR